MMSYDEPAMDYLPNDDSYVWVFNDDGVIVTFDKQKSAGYKKGYRSWSVSGNNVYVSDTISGTYDPKKGLITLVIDSNTTYYLRRGGVLREYITYETPDPKDCFKGGYTSIKIGTSDGRALSQFDYEIEGRGLEYYNIREVNGQMYADVGYNTAGPKFAIIKAKGYVTANIGFDVTEENPNLKHKFGDIDGDGKYSSDDASLILAYYAFLSGFGDTADGTPMTLEQWLYSSHKYDPDKIRGISNNTGDTNCNGRFDPDDASNLLGYYAYASGFAPGEEGKMLVLPLWLAEQHIISEEQAVALINGN